MWSGSYSYYCDFSVKLFWNSSNFWTSIQRQISLKEQYWFQLLNIKFGKSIWEASKLKQPFDCNKQFFFFLSDHFQSSLFPYFWLFNFHTHVHFIMFMIPYLLNWWFFQNMPQNVVNQKIFFMYHINRTTSW